MNFVDFLGAVITAFFVGGALIEFCDAFKRFNM